MAKDDGAPASRREVFRAGVAILAASAAGTAIARAQASPARLAQTKIAKEQLMYQDHPNDGNKCSTCAQFEPPNACKIVAGEISPNGWCAAYAPKQG